MKKTYLFLTVALLTIAGLSACKKKGCMDPLAINYFSKVTTDDGSCSYSTTRMAGDYGYIFDTIDATAKVYSLSISELKVAGPFDENLEEFNFVVDWTTKNMFMPDTLLPQDMSCTGSITDKDNFSCTLVVDPTGTDNDTSYTYTFLRR